MAIIAFQGLKTAVLGPRALGRRVHEMPVGYELGELAVCRRTSDFQEFSDRTAAVKNIKL